MSAKILYNDKLIAALRAGQSATIKTKGSLMKSDIVVDLSQMFNDNTCGEEHLIEVTELPTEYIIEGAMYKIAKTELADVIVVTEDYVESLASLINAGYLPGGMHVIPTKTTDGILMTTDYEYHFYYIEDAEDIFIYADVMGDGTGMWITAAMALGSTNNGRIDHISEATELGGYYILNEVTTLHRFNKANKGLTDIIMQRTSLATYGGLMGMTYSFNNVPTRPSEDILETNLDNDVYHFYYIEDENDLSVYMGGSWIPGAVLANSVAGGELIFVPTAIQGMHEDDNVYAVISDGWSNYVLPSGGQIITENGTYDVTGKEYVLVGIEEKVPDGYVYPDGERTITKNGDYDVTYYASVHVEVPPPPAPSNSIVQSEEDLPTDAVNGSIVFVLGGEVNA